ncbi:MAG TPA: 16S rRNA (uracil(1498)-N(3))-methyltransferase [Rhodospirillaceae bacterium]|nr:16S rRNA (uracil(1498)-N(3))-methyltransferase [Rhodospirillaceae bacterium]
MSKIRLFVGSALAAGTTVTLDAGQAHYLLHVMRHPLGAPLVLFNGRDGEWQASLSEASKRVARAAVERLLRPQPSPSDLWLLFAPVKRARIDLIVEKATELGVGLLVPVLTRHSAVQKTNDQRLGAIAVEAAEQCRRLSVPEIRPLRPLVEVIGDWPAGRRLLVLDESGGGLPIAEALAGLAGRPAALLVGPEGGFDETELDALRRLSFATPIGLGPLILRADTAVVGALACYQALSGDWRRQAENQC